MGSNLGHGNRVLRMARSVYFFLTEESLGATRSAVYCKRNTGSLPRDLSCSMCVNTPEAVNDGLAWRNAVRREPPVI